MSKKILLIDLNEALLQFTPAIYGKSNLNIKQAERLAKKLVTLLEQNCRVNLAALVERSMLLAQQKKTEGK